MTLINNIGVNAMNTKRILYKDDTKEEYHVYTPEELERLNEIARLHRKAVGLYELALELLERVSAAQGNGNSGEATHWDTKSLECELRGRAIQKESLEKQLELLLGIGRIEGWEAPAEEQVSD
jgi:hypothetical protein